MSIQFLHPEFLYGLTALTVPVILHLFNLKKYKRVYFSNFTFLESLQQQRKNSTLLKKWLLLLLRLCLITTIVIAFANPYIPKHGHTKANSNSKQIIIFLDNSFSMTNTGTNSSLFEEAKKHILDIINFYPSGTTFRLLSNDISYPTTFSKSEMYDALSKLKNSPTTKSLSHIFQEVKELSQENSTFFLLSDFQQNMCDFQQIQADSSIETVLLVLKPENHSNLFISNLHFIQSYHHYNQNDSLLVTISNTSDKEFHNIPITFTLNSKKKSTFYANIPALGENSTNICFLNNKHGFYKGNIEIADFPVVFDNKYYFSYCIEKKPTILYIWQKYPNNSFNTLFSDTTSFNFKTLSTNQTADIRLSQYSLVILDGVNPSFAGLENKLEEYINNGGNLFILPSENTEAQNRFLQKIQAPTYSKLDSNTIISYIEKQSPLFRDAFVPDNNPSPVLPNILNFYPLTINSGNEILLQDKKRNILLAAHTFGKSKIYVSAFCFFPDNSNMIYHPLFIPLMTNMVVTPNITRNPAYFLNSEQPIQIHIDSNYRNDLPVIIRKDDGTFEFIAQTRKDYSGDLIITNTHNIREAGIYEVIQGNRIISILAWNHKQTESVMKFCSEEELKQQLPYARIENIQTTSFDHNNQIIKEIVQGDTNHYLTRWFILLAIIILLLEQWIWKKRLN